MSSLPASLQPQSHSARRKQRTTHERTRSVRFTIEPVARNVQREMELELQRWVSPSLATVFPFTPSARGAVSVRRCSHDNVQTEVVLKTVAMTLPPNHDNTATTSLHSGLQGFSCADVSSDLSGAISSPALSAKDSATWSQAQLLPYASAALFDQVGKKISHVASVVDVFTLAGMLRDGRDRSEEERSGDLVCVPKLTKSDLEERGWTMADAVATSPVAGGGGGTAAAVASAHAAVGSSKSRRRGGGGSTNSSPRSISPTFVPPPPHPTVFLYAREYVDDHDSLTTILEDRWGRDYLPLTVMPRWAHCGPVSRHEDGRVAMSPEEARKLEDHVVRWLTGRAKVEKRKRRLMEQNAAAETALRGSVVAAPLTEDHQRLTLHDAADVAWAVAGALAALHGSDLTHGNVKPSNVLVQPWSAEGGDAAARRKVCLTDHLLPLIPDALLEPGAILSLPGWSARETRGYACLKPHDVKVLPHLYGGGPAGAPASDPASYTISGCWLTTEPGEGDGGGSDERGAMTIDGGVEGLSSVAYEAVLLQHFVAPENVLLVMENADASEPTVSTAATGAEAYRVWINQQNPTPAADAYALGVLLWVMVVGRLPPLPQYRRVLFGCGDDTGPTAVDSAAYVDHGTPLPSSYTAVLRRCIATVYETRTAASAKTGAEVEKQLHELTTFLRSDVAQVHLPLVLALARANDVRVVTMDLLVRLLHTDPQHRLKPAELREHAFFRAYGSRRHELRLKFEEARQAAMLSTRQKLRDEEGRSLMPRQMGALARMRSDARHSLERCRSEVYVAINKVHVKDNQRSTTSTTELDFAKRATSLRKSPPMSRARSTHTFASSSPRGKAATPVPASPLTEQRPDEGFGREQLEQTCFLGPASPSLTQYNSSSNSNSNSGSPNGVGSGATTRCPATPSLLATTAKSSPTACPRSPSLPSVSSERTELSSPPRLARTKTLKGGRRWAAALGAGANGVVSPLADDDPPSPLRYGSLSGGGIMEHYREGRHRTLRGVTQSGVHASERTRPVLTPKASWVSEAPAAPLLSLPSGRLAPLVVDAAPARAGAAALKLPLGPRRPAMHIRVTK
jgi:serine/threonine protein kinase